MQPEPTTSSESTGTIDERLVLSERISTWFIDTLTTSAYGGLTMPNRASFSFTRSNTTIVSYSE